jgi:hypothetical protein
MSIDDPAYKSYFGQAMPNPPGIIITAPPFPGEGYTGRIIYSAYGEYLSTDPNIMAKEIEYAFAQAKQEFPTIQTPAPIVKPDVPISPLMGMDVNTLVVIGGVALIVFLALFGRKR